MPVQVGGPVTNVSIIFIIFPIFFIVSGICSLFWPRTMWYLSEGWKFKDAQPSGCYLAVTRIGGLVLLIMGFLVFAIVWSLAHAR
jgi:hypothetical protein